ALDVSGRLGGDPANLAWNQRAGAAHFAQHLATLDRVEPDACALDLWRRRLEARHANRGGEQGHRDSGANHQLAAAFLEFEIFTTNVHGAVQSTARATRHRRSKRLLYKSLFWRLAAQLSVIEQSFGETDHAKAPRAL